MKSLCLFLLLSLLASAAFAQPARPPSDWNAVVALKPGRGIRVETQFARADCHFVHADTASITCHENAQGGLLLRTPAHDVRYLREEIVTIRPLGRRLAPLFGVAGLCAGLVLGGVAGGPILAGPFALALGGFAYVFGDLIDWPTQAWPRDPLYAAP